MFTHLTSLIIPTRNRHDNLYNTLSRLKELKLKFNEILVIDSYEKYKKKIIKICKNFNAKIYFSKPSSALQRNIGLRKVSNKSKYVMFLDDDIIFFEDSFLKMNETIKKFKKIKNYIAGYGFNYIDLNNFDYLSFIKKNFFSKMLNIYSDEEGKVMRNGWHTKISNVKKNKFVEWLHTAATVYELKKISGIEFDESLGQYSYLEDLDFSYRVNSKFHLYLVSKAKFLHPNNINRSGFVFGKLEIMNRYKFVRKNNLDLKLFYFSSLVRLLISLSGILKFDFKSISRSAGNLIGISKCLLV